MQIWAQKFIRVTFVSFAFLASGSLARAESVYVKYRGNVDISSFECAYVTRSSFIRRVCYDTRGQYMLISLDGTYYHYCAIDAGTVGALLNAPSMGAFYNANIRGNFDCQINPIPGNSDLPTPPANPNVYLSQEGMQGDHFGAIAFSTKTGATGYSYDYGSGIDAQNAALYSCGPDCTVVSVFTNACGAFAVGANRGWGSAWASSGSQAQINAMNSCSARTLDCTVVQWACTTR